MKCVPICHYEKNSDWWVSKAIKGHKSTVLSVAWCPNNKVSHLTRAYRLSNWDPLVDSVAFTCTACSSY